jgi:HPt (histidine-containing phosphotransfer) domain-containing protein
MPGRIIREANQQGDSPIDLQDALARLDNDREFLNEMVDEFLSSTPRQLEVLEEAVDKQDVRTVEVQAHSIKGAAGNLSSKRISDLALRLELSGRKGDLTGAKQLIENLRAELETLRKFVNKSVPGKVGTKS